MVRATAACTLGRVFEHVHSPALANRMLKNEYFSHIMAVLSKSSKDAPEVSEEACRAIFFFARGYESISSKVDHLEKNISSELLPFLSGVIHALLSASELVKKTPFKASNIFICLSSID